MKKHKNPYQIFNSYVLRVPLYSFNFYKNCFKGIAISKTRLQDIFETPIVNEAIYLASPELSLQLKKWFQGGITDIKKEDRLRISFLKYISRISSRCTPFGLFASCSVGDFSVKTEIELKTIDSYKRVTRFDMTFLFKLYKSLSNNIELKKQLKFFPNTSLYKIANQYRYVEYTLKEKKKQYMLEGITYSIYIEKILNTARKGKTINDLALTIVDNEITLNEAIDFVHELIDNQVLVSELNLTLTGQDNLKQLISILQTKKGVKTITKKLSNFQKDLIKIDSKYGNPFSEYEELLKMLKQFDKNIENKYMFQTDLFSSTKTNTLDYNVAKTLKTVMPLLNKITLPNKNKALSNFKKTYVNRYEGNELPLSMVLDNEIGIGYPSKGIANNPLVDDLQFERNKKHSRQIEWTGIDSILQRKLIEALKSNKDIMILTDKDFNGFKENWEDLPDTMSSLIEIVNLNNQQKVVIDTIGGSSAANLLARFGHGHKLLKKHIKHITKTEQQISSNNLLAEIIHLPQDRVGNILQRPFLRNHEIPYLGKSSLPKNQQIPIEDIVISVKNNRIFLRSLKLNKYITPRLTNAHNYSNDALPIYHFLCDLQKQNKRPYMHFSWHSILKEYFFLPRVEYKNCILSKARWLINVDDIKSIKKEEKDLNKIKDWREKNKLPRYVELIEGDNTLLIDFENLDSVKMLFGTIKNKKSFILHEFLFIEDGIVKHEGGSFTNQFVVSFYNQKKLDAVND